MASRILSSGVPVARSRHAVDDEKDASFGVGMKAIFVLFAAPARIGLPTAVVPDGHSHFLPPPFLYTVKTSHTINARKTMRNGMRSQYSVLIGLARPQTPV
jgi:hypothetical protein